MMVVDAGGGTVDISTYKFASVKPVSVGEIAPPDCEASTYPRHTVLRSFGFRHSAGFHPREHARLQIFEVYDAF